VTSAGQITIFSPALSQVDVLAGDPTPNITRASEAEVGTRLEAVDRAWTDAGRLTTADPESSSPIHASRNQRVMASTSLFQPPTQSYDLVSSQNVEVRPVYIYSESHHTVERTLGVGLRLAIGIGVAFATAGLGQKALGVLGLGGGAAGRAAGAAAAAGGAAGTAAAGGAAGAAASGLTATAAAATTSALKFSALELAAAAAIDAGVAMTASTALIGTFDYGS